MESINDEENLEFNTGYSYLNNNKFEEAITCFRKVLDINPQNFAALNNLGLAQVRQAEINNDLNLVEVGIENIKNAIELAKRVDPNNDYPDNLILANKVKVKIQNDN